jgi:hypothetical protein
MATAPLMAEASAHDNATDLDGGQEAVGSLNWETAAAERTLSSKVSMRVLRVAMMAIRGGEKAIGLDQAKIERLQTTSPR